VLSTANRIATIVLLVLVLGTGCIQASETPNSEQPLDLLDTLQTVITNNVDSQIAGLNWRNAQIDYEISKGNNLLARSRYAEKQALIALERAEETYRSSINSLIMETTGAYIDLISAKENLEILKLRQRLAEMTLTQVKQKLETGFAGEKDLLDAQASYDSAVLNVVKGRHTLQTATNALVNFLHTSDETEFRANPDPVIPPFDTTIEEALACAAEHSTVVQRKQQVELAQLALDRARAEVVSPLSLEKLENELKIAQLEAEKALSDTKASIQTAYNRYVEALSNIDISLKKLDAAAADLNVSKEKYEKGLVTEYELESVRASYLDSKLSVLTSRYNTINALMQLQNTLGYNLAERWGVE